MPLQEKHEKFEAWKRLKALHTALPPELWSCEGADQRPVQFLYPAVFGSPLAKCRACPCVFCALLSLRSNSLTLMIMNINYALFCPLEKLALQYCSQQCWVWKWRFWFVLTSVIHWHVTWKALPLCCAMAESWRQHWQKQGITSSW